MIRTPTLATAILLVAATIGAGLAALPTASAAQCRGSLPAGATFECHSDGPGACGAAVFVHGTSSGGGCMAADYPPA